MTIQTISESSSFNSQEALTPPLTSEENAFPVDLVRKYLPVPSIPGEDNRGIFSSLVKLPYLLHNEQYLFMNLPPYYPEYYSRDTFKILCLNSRKLRSNLDKKMQAYKKAGFSVQSSNTSFGINYYIFKRGEKKKELCLQIIDNLETFSKGRLSEKFKENALKNVLKISRNGFYTYFFSKEAQREYIEAFPEKGKGERSLELMLIWNHGLKYKRQIISIINNYEGFNVLSVHKAAYKKLSDLVDVLYEKEKVSPIHISNKVKHLKKLDNKVALILFENKKRELKTYGKGDLKTVQCERVKALKDLIRNQFNTREKGMRTEAHVIHASDDQKEAESLLRFFNLSRLTRKPHKENYG
jgi:hypothetical protein